MSVQNFLKKKDYKKPWSNIRCQSATFDADKAIVFNGNVPVDNSIIDCLGIASDGSLAQKKFSQLDTFDCIIPDNHATLGEAISSGCRNIYTRNGIYNETVTATTTDSISITCESVSDVEFNYSTVAGNAMSFGNTPFIGSGTIAINNGSSTVTGTGTNFLSIPTGYLIQFIGFSLAIDSIASDTSMTLKSVYRGKSFIFAKYTCLPPISVKLRNFRVTGSGNIGVNVNGCSNLIIDHVLSDNHSSYGFNVDNFSVGYINNIYSKSNGATGIFIRAVYSYLSFQNVNSNNNNGRGVCHDQTSVSGGQGSTHIISNCNFTGNASYGFHTIQSEGTVIVDNCNSIFNNNHGFFIENPSVPIIISNCKTRGNNGNGFRLANNVSIGDIFTINCSAINDNLEPFSIGGTNITIDGCLMRGITTLAVIVLNTGFNYLTLTNNKTNCTDLIKITSPNSINNCIISNNNLIDPAPANITVLGVNNVISNNRVSNITINGNFNVIDSNIAFLDLTLAGGNKCSVNGNNCNTMTLTGINHAVSGNTIKSGTLIDNSSGSVFAANNTV